MVVERRLTIQAERVAELVQMDVDVLLLDALEEVVGAHALAPVAARAAFEAVREPERHVCLALANRLLQWERR